MLNWFGILNKLFCMLQQSETRTLASSDVANSFGLCVKPLLNIYRIADIIVPCYSIVRNDSRLLTFSYLNCTSSFHTKQFYSFFLAFLRYLRYKYCST